MTLKVKCDRCGVEANLRSNEMPPNEWTVIDHNHLCPNCDKEFQRFIEGKDIVAIVPDKSLKPYEHNHHR